MKSLKDLLICEMESEGLQPFLADDFKQRVQRELTKQEALISLFFTAFPTVSALRILRKKEVSRTGQKQAHIRVFWT
jgi:hypothetical protein